MAERTQHAFRYLDRRFTGFPNRGNRVNLDGEAPPMAERASASEAVGQGGGLICYVGFYGMGHIILRGPDNEL